MDSENLFKLDSVAFEKLLVGNQKFIEVRQPNLNSNRKSDLLSGKGAILSGAFNPIHQGHLKMADYSSAKLDCAVWLELSIVNADKPTIGIEEVINRASKIVAHEDYRSQGILLTNVATFGEKASLFPGKTFIVGADTVERINQSKYYKNDPLLRDEAIENIASIGCSFLVFGRQIDGDFKSHDVTISPALRSLCQFVPQVDFNDPISSTEIRNSTL